MKTRLLAASLVLVPTIAFAQAPGESYYAPPSEAPVVAPTPVVVVQPAREIEPMADRFAVNVNLGGFSVAPEDSPEGSETNFSLAEPQLRFRATRRLEILLAFAGGRQQLDNDEEGDLAMDQVTLGLRFNFRPAHHWNWYLMAGFGSTLIAPHDTPEELREDMRRGHAVFGIGLEHRWRHFALSAELRGVAVEEKDDMYETLPVDSAKEPASLMDGRELGGGQFTIGASYYF